MSPNKMTTKPAQYYVLATSIKWDSKDTTNLPKQVYAPIHNPLIPHRFLMEHVKDWIENEYGSGISGFTLSTIS